MKKILFLLTLSSLPLLAQEPVPAKVAPEDVLFLAHFNSSLKPEAGISEGIVEKTTVTTGNKGYPFKNSAPRAEALDVSKRNQYAAFSAKGFNVQEGTLQFFVQGKWGKKGHYNCVFFKLIFNNDYESNWGGPESFIVRKRPDIQALQAYQNGNLRNPGVTTAELPHATDIWRHITVTWDRKAKKYHFYVDGELIGSSFFYRMRKSPLEFLLGHPKGWGAMSLIDEVRILKRALTPEEVKQDYLYLKNGNEFPLPATVNAAPEAKDISFAPVAPAEKKPTASIYSDVTINVAGITGTAPVIDGKLDDAIWQNAAKVPPFFSRKKVAAPADPQTEVKMFYNAEALFIGAKLYEPDMKNLVARFDQNDLGIYNDDCLEFLLDTGGEKNYFHFAINALGSVFDARAGKSVWNAQGMKVKSFRGQDFWSLEIMLPFSAFRTPTPEPGEYFGIRLARERHHGSGNSTYPHYPVGKLGERTKLAKLFFAPALGSKGQITVAATTFTLGMNRIGATVSGLEGNFRIRTRLYDAGNRMLAEKNARYDAAGKVEFMLPVTDDRTERAVIALLDEKNNAVGSWILQRKYPSLQVSLAELDRQLKVIEHSCFDLFEIKHPVYRGAGKAVKEMRKALDQFNAEVKTAVDNGKTVEDQKVSDIMALANGFLRFRDRYRYLVWQTSPWENGSLTPLPDGDPTETPLILNFRQAGNERERITLYVAGLLCGKRLELRFVPTGVSKRKVPYIPLDNFEIYTEPFTNHDGELITAPLIRADGNIITVTPGEAVRVHIVFNSREVPAGRYKSEIILKPLYDYAIADQKIPVNMEVWNFTLPETRDWPIDSFFWGPNRLDNDEAAMLKLMHSRHINYGWTESCRYTRGFYNMRNCRDLPDKSKPFNPEVVMHANEEFFRTAKELGMKFVFGWGTCKSVEWHQLMDKRLTGMGFSREDFIFKEGIGDEFMKSDIPRHAEFRKELKKVDPGWTFQAVYLSTPPPKGATLKDLEDNGLPQFFKNWTVISGVFSESEKRCQETLAFFKKYNCKLWLYHCATKMQKQAVLEYFRFTPWRGYKYKTDGVAMWDILEARGIDGFDHRDGYDDGAAWLGNDRKPVPTKRLEAFSEGLEDVAYMHELDKQLKRLEKVLSKEESTKLRELITTRMLHVMKLASQAHLDAWRIELGETIDRLSRIKTQP
ncbi:MAG: hypothetical protein E7058_08190 [Lentisphaerae bacterium]|nr:hypothetical protein [Lentisphaerota bacterium]